MMQQLTIVYYEAEARAQIDQAKQSKSATHWHISQRSPFRSSIRSPSCPRSGRPLQRQR